MMMMKLFKLFKKRKIQANGSLFEDLTNEIYYEIFDYLSYNEIISSFFNLNIRFDNLISNYPQHFHLGNDQIIPKYIRSFKITLTSQISLFDPIESSHFCSLRSISLSNLRCDQILGILNTIPSKQLEHIYLGICIDDRKANFSKVLSSIQIQVLSLTHYRLKSCQIKDQFSLAISDLLSQYDQLEYLQIKFCENFSFLSEILLRTPKLNSLDVSLRESNQSILTPNQCYLTTLNLRPHSTCSIAELKDFLGQCCSHLHNLSVYLYIHRHTRPELLVDKDQWTNILPIQLKYFRLKSIPNPSIHFYQFGIDNEQCHKPFHDQIYFLSEQHHVCRVRIDAVFVKYWNR
ncbi:unnamed protein product [Adineta ricciae]|uniref:F-box domain-containing protein n=1 Tax=Adineta ricciae TaxID=249248 RepID=A0A816F4Z6_ADIRI|nr:unnamed protein product [Adineta ricciae]CAF1657915.1 unnamed protein product [Adineta ricciae]